MAKQSKTMVAGSEEREVTYEKRTRSFFLFFKIIFWEKVNEKHIGNDIFIQTEREIKNVYLNGKKIN